MLRHHLAADLRQNATAHLAQTMTFLHMTNAELETRLHHELAYNPALEMLDGRHCPECGRKLTRHPCPACAAARADEPLVYFTTPEHALYRPAPPDDQRDAFEPTTADTLESYVLRQIAPALATPAERQLAMYVLGQLDEDGLLTEAPAETAWFNRVPLALVENVLALIQHADPPGLGAASPTEALLLQLDSLRDNHPASTLEAARTALTHHADLLAHREWGALGRALGWSRAQAESLASFIQRNLNPYPARAFWGREAVRPAENGWRAPDAAIALTETEAGNPQLLVEIFTPWGGYVRVNPNMQKILEADPAVRHTPWAQQVEQASLLARCLQQRNATLRRLLHLLATHQREFILRGDRHMKPLTRAQVAQHLGVHESTISRGVAGKTLALPSGRVVALAHFFDRSLSVRDRVKDIVAAETTPLTDDDIVAHLAAAGVTIARRTVSKYRAMLGILPAHLRGQPRLARATP